MEKKYRLTNETIRFKGTTLYRIEALKDFFSVEKGDKGGFVESENNLSHDGKCWVYDDAKVYGNAKVYDNVKVYGDAQVYDNVKVYGQSQVFNNVKIFGKAKFIINFFLKVI